MSNLLTDAVQILILKPAFPQWMFKNVIPNMRFLHTAKFDIRNIKHGKLALEIGKAAEMIEKPDTPALRRLSINDVHWEASEGSCLVVIELTFYILSPRMTGFLGVRGTVRCEMGRGQVQRTILGPYKGDVVLSPSVAILRMVVFVMQKCSLIPITSSSRWVAVRSAQMDSMSPTYQGRTPSVLSVIPHNDLQPLTHP